MATFAKWQHIQPVLSLGKTRCESGLRKFGVRAQSLGKDVAITVEPKIDGLAINLVYVNGKLVKAVTRGDGFTGRVVTRKARTLLGVPHSIDIAGTIEVRGEAYITHKNLDALNKAMIATGRREYKSCRSAASACMMDKYFENGIDINDPSSAYRVLNFRAYGTPTKFGKTYSETMERLSQAGFATTATDIEFYAEDIDNMLSVISEFNSSRENLGFDIDGVVFKIVDFEAQEKLGATRNAPNWAIALKWK